MSGKTKMSLVDALEIVEPLDLPDGAWFTMLEELTGLDPSEVAVELTKRHRRDLVSAIRVLTVDMPNGEPNGPEEEAVDRLGNALERGDLAAAGDAYIDMLEASADNLQRLREAAEAVFGGDFRAPEPKEQA